MSHKDYAEDWNYESEVMGEGVTALAEAVVGRRIVKAERGQVQGQYYSSHGVMLTLDDGTEVNIADTDDCCAFSTVESLEFLASVDNAITAVEANEDFTTWHVYAAEVPVVTLGVDWSPGNPYYYGFGLNINVRNKKEEA